MLEQFSATVELLYAAAADPTLWQAALRAIEDYTGSTGAVLNLVPKTASAMPICLAGSFSDDGCADYAANYMWRCPRIGFAEAHPDVPVHWDHMILTEYEMDRDATYEWYGSHGLRYYVAGWIGGTDHHHAYMSLQRSRRQGHIEPKNVEQFKLVLKHMAQALTLAVRLGTLDQQCRFDLALIDAMPQAVFALDGAGKVVLTNAKADCLLSEADALVVFDGKLQCRSGSEQARFMRVVAAALEASTVEPKGGWVRIERVSKRRALMAFVAPLMPPESLIGAIEPRALVIIGDAADGLAVDEQALHDLFGLTHAEARLTCALSAGHSLESAAALLGVQPTTVRSELKSVFRKTAVNRQQDLVRLITSLSLTPGIHATRSAWLGADDA
jgi:DNA-binding CsgD family transcriptional regulator